MLQLQKIDLTHKFEEAYASTNITEKAEKTPTSEAPLPMVYFRLPKEDWHILFANCQTVMMGSALIHLANVYNLVQHVSSHIDPQLHIAPVQKE